MPSTTEMNFVQFCLFKNNKVKTSNRCRYGFPEINQAEVSDFQNGVDIGPPVVFLRERSLFGLRKPTYDEYIIHKELYKANRRNK